jgi:hypothetical protein
MRPQSRTTETVAHSAHGQALAEALDRRHAHIPKRGALRSAPSRSRDALGRNRKRQVVPKSSSAKPGLRNSSTRIFRFSSTNEKAVAPVKVHRADPINALAREPVVAGLASLRSQPFHGGVE